MFRKGRELEGPEARSDCDAWKDLEPDVGRAELPVLSGIVVVSCGSVLCLRPSAALQLKYNKLKKVVSREMLS